MHSSTDPSAGSGLRIAAVSRITKIPVDTLRAWERRYGVVTPMRSETSARLYTEEDVRRLKLIKALVDRGHGIGSIAGLSYAELEEQLHLHEPAVEVVPAERKGPSSLLVLGRFLPDQLSSVELDGRSWRLLSTHSAWGEFEAAAKADQPDALVVEAGALMPGRVTDVLQLADHHSYVPEHG